MQRLEKVGLIPLPPYIKRDKTNETQNIKDKEPLLGILIESKKGLKNLKEICEFKERIKIVSFGSHDLAKSINLKVSDDEKEILSYRKLIVSHSKNPIDTSYLNFKDLIGFEKSCNLAKNIGFGGKACIHPGQIEISNKIF